MSLAMEESGSQGTRLQSIRKRDQPSRRTQDASRTFSGDRRAAGRATDRMRILARGASVPGGVTPYGVQVSS